jgi:hypothetical protein
MPDFAGPLQRVVLSRTLWLIVALPLLGCAWHIGWGRRAALRAVRPEDVRRALQSAHRVGVASIALATEATLGHLLALVRAGADGGALLQHVAGGARVGQLEAGIALWFDPLSAAACTLVCVVALAAVVLVAWRPPSDHGWRTWAWIELSLGGALLTFLADGFVTMAIGWALAAAAQAWLAGWNSARPRVVAATRGALAIATMLFGAALLFWGLGGEWQGDDEYVRDRAPRFAKVHVGAWSDVERPRPREQPAGGNGSLSLASVPGALVFLDEARAPAMRAPFIAVPVAVGAHGLRVHTGDASSDTAIGPMVVGPAESLALVPRGPTLSFRDLMASLVVRDRSGEFATVATLEGRPGPGGLDVVTLVLMVLLVAAVAMSAHLPPVGAPLTLAAMGCAATTMALGPFPLLRLAALVSIAPRSVRMIVDGGAVTLALTWLAATARLLRSARRGDGLVHGARRVLTEDVLLERAPERLGLLLVAFERGVVDAFAGAVAALFGVAVWVAARSDVHLLAAPADAVAKRAVRLGRGVEPTVGGSLASFAWAIAALTALAALAHALWPR